LLGVAASGVAGGEYSFKLVSMVPLMVMKPGWAR